MSSFLVLLIEQNNENVNTWNKIILTSSTCKETPDSVQRGDSWGWHGYLCNGIRPRFPKIKHFYVLHLLFSYLLLSFCHKNQLKVQLRNKRMRKDSEAAYSLKPFRKKTQFWFSHVTRAWVIDRGIQSTEIWCQTLIRERDPLSLAY